MSITELFSEAPTQQAQNEVRRTHRSVKRGYRLGLSTLVFVLAMRICGVPPSFITQSGDTAYLVNDDSMITLRVAHHIAQHLGPYFNQGEHVAASTSLFWPYFMSPVFWAIHDPGKCVLALALLSALIASLTVASVTFVAESTLASCGVAATLLLLPSLSYYGSSAWEQVPQMLLVTMAFLALLGRIHVFARYRVEAALVLAAMAFLVRPDTLPILFVLGVGVLMRRRGWMSYAAMGLACLALCGYYGLHHHLYGTFVPNTYYLKVHFGAGAVVQGLRYLAVSAVDTAIPVLLLAGLILRLWRPAAVTFEEKLLIVSLAAQCVYVVVIGGDIFHYGRFLVILAPISAFILWEGISEIMCRRGDMSRKQWGVIGGCFTMLVAASFVKLVRDHQFDQRVWSRSAVSAPSDDLADQASLAGCLSSHISPEDGQIGIFTLGSLPYYMTDYSFADFLGKADTIIAHEQPRWGPTGHNKWDIRHSLQDRHVSVVPFQMLPDEVARKMVLEHAPAQVRAVLQLDPYMLANYTYRSPAQLGLPGPYGLLVRNDLRAKLASPCTSGS